MSKTINYELAKKLYDAGVRIESEEECLQWTESIPTPNCAEVIEFLNTISIVFERPNNYTTKMYNFVITMCGDCGYVVSCQYEDKFLFEFDNNILLEALEATLEYLLSNGYIGTKEKK